MVQKLRAKLKTNNTIVNAYRLLSIADNFFRFKPILFTKKMFWFFRQLNDFLKLGKNENFKSILYYPCLFDNIPYTLIDYVYFYQDCWAAKHIFELKPSHHYDIGSHIRTIGILSQFVPITMIDIRPPDIELPNLFFIKGSILELPFDNNSIYSLSSLCV
ncbi:MAG: hypothetical protein ACK4OM_08325, partial [Alphaproteobacteria bacterium]